jgi:hypothetical protein
MDDQPMTAYHDHIAVFSSWLAELELGICRDVERLRTILDDPAVAPTLSYAMNLPNGVGDWRVVRMMMEYERGGGDLSTMPGAVEYHLLHAPIVDQHRRKIAWIGRQIQDSIDHHFETGNILVLACGPGYEVQNVVPRLNTRIFLIDSDAEALGYARRNVSNAVSVCSDWTLENVLRSQQVTARRYDLAVASGLFDYLPDALAIGLLRRLALSCTRVALTNLDRNPWSFLMREVMRWRVIERDPDSLARLCETAGWRVGTYQKEQSGITWCVMLESETIMNGIDAEVCEQPAPDGSRVLCYDVEHECNGVRLAEMECALENERTMRRGDVERLTKRIDALEYTVRNLQRLIQQTHGPEAGL